MRERHAFRRNRRPAGTVGAALAITVLTGFLPGRAAAQQATGPEGTPVLDRNPAAELATDRIVRAPVSEPGAWLTYYGGYEGQRYSRLDQIDTTNVGRLAQVWTKSWPITHKFEATPLVADGVMYVTTGGAPALYALDATTGEEFWRFQPPVNVDIPICCGHVNRGAALGRGMVYYATLDATLYALDARTGELQWRTQFADPQEGYSATLAPLFVKDKVLVGVSGGEYGIRGYIDAYDARTGERVWRFYTIPAPGEPGSETWENEAWQTGGGPAWITGTYDADLDLVFWGTGNPSPDLNGEVRPGDNLYTSSVVALDPDTGELRWHYQYTPHDVWDYDAVQVQMAVDVPIAGLDRRVILHADKNGYFYVLDRTTGEFIYATPLARRTWVKRLDPQTGRPVIDPEGLPSAYYKPMCPSVLGATEWVHMAYHPGTRMAYIPVIEQCARFRTEQAFYEPGLPFWGGHADMDAYGPAESHGFLTAIDVTTGDVAWKVESKWPVIANVLTTAGGLVFWRESNGLFHGTNARSGEQLWTDHPGNGTRGSVMTYAVDGRQYIAWTAAAPEEPHHHRLVVYALP